MNPSSTTARICLVCQREYAKYMCPRCNTPYCTLQCYKGHSETCTETFYKESACEEMKGMSAGTEQRQQMMEALERESNAQAEALEEVHEGLEDLDLDNLSIDQLTPAQRRDFERAILDGRLSSSVSPWTPWWIRTKGSDRPQGIAMPPDLPALDSLLHGKSPAPTLGFHLVELLYAYAYVSRQYNGEWSDDPLGAAAVCSSCLLYTSPSPRDS
eukprot:TRINITY_DN12263_c0_g1_i1.p1 TRINITY_DN12263_c0_g1~~TRINITY_DN12263_c0_g1_i1.p1  ORF type:complete len:214 (+),score=36.96 TRINITY_DN12263_c0_g1_i1:164-805(+)